MFGDLQYHEAAELWAFPVRLTGHAGSDHIPAPSAWYVVADGDYPLGALRVHPARENGIEVTFPHQMANGGDDALPWRPGYLCLQLPEQTLSVAQESPEPLDGDLRMEWALARTVGWVAAALAGTLLKDGAAFELPHVPAEGPGRIIARESPDTFTALDGVRGGRLNVHRWKTSHIAAVGEIRDMTRNAVHEGPRLRAGVGEATFSEAAWVMLGRGPFVDPWGMPHTWGDLAAPAVCGLPNLFATINAARCAGDKPNQIDTVLLGFPVPERVGAAPSQVRWLAAKLPPLPKNGFRPDAWDLFMRTTAKMRRIEWIHVENWSDHQLYGRGSLTSDDLRNEPVVIIGGGAVGSHLALLLAKGGSADITIIDGEILEVGNLTRHVLGVDSIGHNKARALAAHLRLATPTANVTAVPAALQSLDGAAGEAIARARTVIDCTAGDIVPAVLAQLDDDKQRWFYSLMLGWEAKRMHVYSVRDIRMRQDHYVKETAAIAELERSERGETAVDPDVGCWHPAFPASGADVVEMVARAVRLINEGTTWSPKTRTINQQSTSAPVEAPA